MTYSSPRKAAAVKTTCTEEKSPKNDGPHVVLSDDLSHDLRTPLNIIIGFSELMLEEIPGKINEEQRRDLKDILSSGQRLLGLVNAMLGRVEGQAP